MILLGQTSTHLPQLMHAVSGLLDTTSSLKARIAEEVFVTGASSVTMANPIIGPPEISFSGSVLNPPAASISSLWFVPRSTRKLPGDSTASPLTVTIRSVRGLPQMTDRKRVV